MSKLAAAAAHGEDNRRGHKETSHPTRLLTPKGVGGLEEKIRKCIGINTRKTKKTHMFVYFFQHNIFGTFGGRDSGRLVLGVRGG